MNSNVIYIIDDVQEPQLEPAKLEKENNMCDIVGMVGDQYIVKHVGWIKQRESTNYSDKGLKRVKIKTSDNKRIGDQILIENL